MLSGFHRAPRRSRLGLGIYTFVSWDVEDSSILTKVDPELTAKRIEAALIDKCYYDTKIFAFVDSCYSVDYALIENFACGRIQIVVVPKGRGKTGRFNSMASTTIFLAMNNLREPACALLLSKDKGFETIVDALKQNHFQAGLFDPLDFLCFYGPDPVDQRGSSQPLEQTVPSSAE